MVSVSAACRRQQSAVVCVGFGLDEAESMPESNGKVQNVINAVLNFAILIQRHNTR